jgi:AraC family ethanolamine operon transcriptional activator
VRDLSEIVSVKERTLQHNFLKYLGVTPKQYLKSIMLNRARKELKRSGKHNDIKMYQIAHQFGFWHMGQFAADYRRFFGELPSETLKNLGT